MGTDGAADVAPERDGVGQRARLPKPPSKATNATTALPPTAATAAAPTAANHAASGPEGVGLEGVGFEGAASASKMASTMAT